MKDRLCIGNGYTVDFFRVVIGIRPVEDNTDR